MYYHFLQTVLRLNCVGSVERKAQRSRLTRQREPVVTRLSRHIVGMRDGIDQVRSALFTVDQLAARSNFGSSGRQLFCARLRQHLIGQSKIIRRTRAAVTRRDPHTCCELDVITRLEFSFFLAGIHHRRLFSIRRRLGLIGIFAHEFGLKHLASHSASVPLGRALPSFGGGEHSEQDEQCSPVFVVFGRTWRTHPLRGVRFGRLHVRSRLSFRGPCLVVPCSDVLLADQIFGCALKCLLPRSRLV